jgi:hypothetical protein
MDSFFFLIRSRAPGVRTVEQGTIRVETVGASRVR